MIMKSDDFHIPPRLFILAIDGLEYNLVEEWKLSEIKQKFCCAVDVSEFKHLLTPIIWASFITGLEPEKHGIQSWWRGSSNEIVDLLIHKLRYQIPFLSKANPTLLRQVGKLFGLKERAPDVVDLRRRGASTIFDYASHPVALFIPSYNEPTAIRIEYSEAVENGVSTYVRTLWKVHSRRVDTIFRKIDAEWDLFMAWLDIADQICHVYSGLPRGKLKIMNAYLRLNQLVREIRNSLEDGVLFMIVSDHGFDIEKAHHSNHAFFSTNINIPWKPKSILDYAPFIKEVLCEVNQKTQS